MYLRLKLCYVDLVCLFRVELEVFVSFQVSLIRGAAFLRDKAYWQVSKKMWTDGRQADRSNSAHRQKAMSYCEC